MSSTIIILLVSFFALLFLGVPVAVTIGLSSLITMLFIVPPDLILATASTSTANGVNSFTLLAIPFFIFSGNIMNRGGLAIRLVNLAKLVIGWMPGSLFYVNVLTNMLFGALSGSAAAAGVAVGKVLDPLQKAEKYDTAMASAVNAASCPTGLLIPPSNTLILYSLVSGGTSVSALFMAGYIPGVLMGLAVMFGAFLYCLKHKYPKSPSIGGFKKALKIIWEAVPSLLLIIIIVGGISLGIFTATEASAIAVLYSFILAFSYKMLDKTTLKQIMTETIVLSGIVLFLISTSGMLSWVLSFSGIPGKVASGMLAISSEPTMILLMINVILLIAGMFMDMSASVLIFTPIFLPIARQIGVDPVHFGIIMVFNLCIGLITPPVGNALFVAVSVSKADMGETIQRLIPMILWLILMLLVVTFVPSLSLWLPRTLGLM